MTEYIVRSDSADEIREGDEGRLLDAYPALAGYGFGESYWGPDADGSRRMKATVSISSQEELQRLIRDVGGKAVLAYGDSCPEESGGAFLDGWSLQIYGDRPE